MSPADWAGLAVAVMTLTVGFSAAIRWLVKHYLNELKPNGGSSLKDKVNSLDSKVEFLTDLIIEALKKQGNMSIFDNPWLTPISPNIPDEDLYEDEDDE